MLEAEVAAVRKAQAEENAARQHLRELRARIDEATTRVDAASNAVYAATKALLEASGLRYAKGGALDAMEGRDRA
jgi:hypothetical protein